LRCGAARRRSSSPLGHLRATLPDHLLRNPSATLRDRPRAPQDLAYVLACGYVALSLLLSGFYMRTGELRIRPLVWLSYASYPRRAARCAYGTPHPSA